MGCGASKGGEGGDAQAASTAPGAADHTATSKIADTESEALVTAFTAPKAALQNYGDDASFSSKHGQSSSHDLKQGTIAAKHGSSKHKSSKDEDDEFNYNLAAAPAGRAAAPPAGGLLTQNGNWLEQEQAEQGHVMFSNEAPAGGALFTRAPGSHAASSLPPLGNHHHELEMRRRSKVMQSSAGALHAEPLLPDQGHEQQQDDPNVLHGSEPAEAHSREQQRHDAHDNQQHQRQHQQQHHGHQHDNSSYSDEDDMDANAGGHRHEQADRSASSSPTPATQRLDPSDPWSALQSQYQIRNTTSTSTIAASKRGLPGAPVGRVTQEELVLVDDGEDEDSPGRQQGANGAAITQRVALRAIPNEESSRSLVGGGSASQRGHFGGGALGGGSFRSGGKDGGHAAVHAPHMKQGGWGQGQLAAPGTLMLGAQGNAAPQERQRDGVFDDSDDESGQGAAHDGGVSVPGAVFEDGTFEEDLEDVDELLAAQDAKSNALPGDLASKLARFEAMAGDDDNY